ncbi:MAG: aminodeoxychorismate synthase component I [Pseudomonadota bacterium]
MHQPPAPPDRHPRCRIDTRLPGSGQAMSLIASGPARQWQARNADGLIGQLAGAVDELVASGSAGLLVGLLPYPDDGGAMQVRLPARMAFFDHFRRSVPGSPTDDEANIAGHSDPFRLTRRFIPDWTRDGYMAAVRRVQDYLVAGDAYQVNLAQRFTAGYEGDPRVAFDLLRARFTPPYAAWLDFGDWQVLCLSPESFLEVDGRCVTTRPIKGTRARGADPAADAALAADLVTHPKDRAENLMIVDLLRNDLGKVCAPGSIRTPELFQVESFHNVHHLVSTVTGTLPAGVGMQQLLAACFPGGSITGAPKRRAMEIINELEPHPRAIYCGTIFWATADGQFGSNIAIRTFVTCNGVLHGWAGAGIVADSDPATEYQECLDKLAPLMHAIEDHFLE